MWMVGVYMSCLLFFVYVFATWYFSYSKWSLCNWIAMGDGERANKNAYYTNILLRLLNTNRGFAREWETKVMCLYRYFISLLNWNGNTERKTTDIQVRLKKTNCENIPVRIIQAYSVYVISSTLNQMVLFLHNKH